LLALLQLKADADRRTSSDLTSFAAYDRGNHGRQRNFRPGHRRGACPWQG
jgi:hypothetical protein